jgi:HD-like signal output (HDOD) protein
VADSIGMHDLTATIEAILLQRIANDSLRLPAQPAIAIKVRDALDRGDVQFGRLARMIAEDPLLAAEIVHAASAAAFGASHVTSLVAAMNRLGAVRLMRVVVEALARQLFTSKDPKIAAEFARILEHSVAVAKVSDGLGRAVDPAIVEDAFLVGLLHDLGKVVVANTLLAAEHSLPNLDRARWRDDWLACTHRLQRKVGAVLAERWRLSPSLSSYLTLEDDFDATAPRSAVNVVRLANAAVKLQGLTAGPADRDELVAIVEMGKLVCELDGDLVTEVVTEALPAAPAVAAAR